MSAPRLSDALASRLAALAASRIEARPELLGQAAIRLRMWLGDGGRGSFAEGASREWVGIIESRSPAEVCALLREESPEAQRLRSSMPFVGPDFFSEAERDAALDAAAAP